MQSEDIRKNIEAMWLDPLEFGRALGYKGVAGRKEFGTFHDDMVRHTYSQPRTSTIVPRGHAKSTCITVIDTCWHLLRHPESRNLLASATLDLAKKLVGEVRDRLNGDIELAPGVFLPVREVFPWIAPTGDRRKSGPTDKLNISGRAGTGREPSVFAASVESNLAGNHPTRAVIDDPANEQNSRTHSRRTKVIEFIETLEPLMYAPDSPIRHIGTPWAFSDVTNYLAERPDWSQFRYSVWDGVNPETGEKDGRGPGPEGGWSLCPSFLTGDEIIQKAEALSKQFFAAQYLCHPVPAEEAIFEPALIAAATHTYDTPADLPDGPEILLYDPVARISGVNGDLNAIIIFKTLTARALGLKGFPDDRNIFIPVYAHEIAGGADLAAQHIEELAAERPALKSIWIEQVASQSLFGPWLEERGKIKAARIRGQKIGTSSLAYRLMGLQTGMRKGYILFPKKFPGSELLRRRLIEFPKSESDDLVSAFALLSTHLERRGALPGVDYGTPLPYNLQPGTMTSSTSGGWPG